MDWRQLAWLFPSQGKIFTKKAKKQDENKDIIKNKILTLFSLHLTLDSRESWERGLFEFSSVTLTSKLEAMFHTHLKKIWFMAAICHRFQRLCWPHLYGPICTGIEIRILGRSMRRSLLAKCLSLIGPNC